MRVMKSKSQCAQPPARPGHILFFIVPLLLVHACAPRRHQINAPSTPPPVLEVVAASSSPAPLTSSSKALSIVICPSHCAHNISTLALHIAPRVVSRLENTPLALIGTDQAHAIRVTTRDVINLHAHIRAWRLAARARRAVVISNCARNTIVMDALAHSMATDITLLDRDCYALSARTVKIMLAEARAFVVPLSDFMLAVASRHELGIENIRPDTHSNSAARCDDEEGESVWSDSLPFYPPMHWLHSARDADARKHVGLRHV